MAGDTDGITGDGGALRRARALSTPTRVQIMRTLRAASAPMTAAELADAIGVHHTVIREHLALLADAGMVSGAQLPIIGRGRPRTGYVSAVGVPEDAYVQLATLLAEAMASGVSAREAGRRAGASLQPREGGAVPTLQYEAERLGFRPTVRSSGEVHEIVLRQCPFEEVALTSPQTVCDLHLGLAEGVCERVGGAVVERLHVADPRQAGCCITLREA